MIARFSIHFEKALSRASENIRTKFYKQLRLLLGDFKHPSLRVKKYDESRDIWQARVDHRWRFYFIIESNTYYFLDIIRHPK